jgi:deoxycytidine triphosphate deaminase
MLASMASTAAATAVLLIGLMVTLPQLLLFFELPRITRARMGLIIPMSVALAIDFVDPGFWVRYRRVTTVVLI